jgi:hypothetical protein
LKLWIGGLLPRNFTEKTIIVAIDCSKSLAKKANEHQKSDAFGRVTRAMFYDPKREARVIQAVNLPPFAC